MGVKRQNQVKIANFAKAAKPVDFLKVSKPARIPGQVRRELRTQSPPSKGQISKSFRGKFSELTAPPGEQEAAFKIQAEQSGKPLRQTPDRYPNSVNSKRRSEPKLQAVSAPPSQAWRAQPNGAEAGHGQNFWEASTLSGRRAKPPNPESEKPEFLSPGRAAEAAHAGHRKAIQAMPEL